MVSKAVEKLTRQRVFSQLPTKEDIQNNRPVNIQVNVTKLRTAEEKNFDDLVRERNFEDTNLLQEDASALEYFRGLLGGLFNEINSVN